MILSPAALALLVASLIFPSGGLTLMGGTGPEMENYFAMARIILPGGEVQCSGRGDWDDWKKLIDYPANASMKPIMIEARDVCLGRPVS